MSERSVSEGSAGEGSAGERSAAGMPASWLYGLAAYGLWLAVSLITVSAVDDWRGVISVLLLAFAGLLWGAPEGAADERRAHAWLALQTGLLVAICMLGRTAFPLMLLFALSVHAMTLLPPRRGLPWILAFAVLTAALSTYWDGLRSGLQAGMVFGAGYLFFAVFGYTVMRAEAAERESRRLLQALREANEELKGDAERAEALAVAEERNRLARELHDTLGHRMTVALVQLEGAERLAEREPARAAEMIGVVRDQLQSGMEDLRASVSALQRPREGAESLRAALEGLAADFRAGTGVDVALVLPEEDAGLDALGPERRLALFRAAQEGLTNVQRHAGATRAWIALEPAGAEGGWLLRVEDDGRGIDPAAAAEAEGYGLRGLRERAAALGGRTSVEPRPEGGTRLALRLPAAGGGA